jgi:hypothetical protein
MPQLFSPTLLCSVHTLKMTMAMTVMATRMMMLMLVDAV